MNKQIAIKVSDLNVGYNSNLVLKNISLDVLKGEITSIIGINGCGKSTLLKAMGAILPFKKGSIHLYGKDINGLSKKHIAKILAYLSQKHIVPSDITVKELVAFGRFAHRKWYQQPSAMDNKIVNEMIKITGLKEYEDRRVTSLSGGESQKAWIAMSLAQEPEILLLDEPTTFLDIYHQIEVLELLKSLNLERNLTILMVLHDINHAYKYSDSVITIKDGIIHSEGSTKNVVNTSLLEDVFRIKSKNLFDSDCGEIFHPYSKK